MAYKHIPNIALGLFAIIAACSVLCVANVIENKCVPSSVLVKNPEKTLVSRYGKAMATVSAYLVYDRTADSEEMYLPLNFVEVLAKARNDHVELRADCAIVTLNVELDHTEYRMKTMSVHLGRPNAEGGVKCLIKSVNLDTDMRKHVKLERSHEYKCHFEDLEYEHQNVRIGFDALEFEVARPDGSPRDKYNTPAFPTIFIPSHLRT